MQLVDCHQQRLSQSSSRQAATPDDSRCSWSPATGRVLWPGDNQGSPGNGETTTAAKLSRTFGDSVCRRTDFRIVVQDDIVYRLTEPCAGSAVPALCAALPGNNPVTKPPEQQEELFREGALGHAVGGPVSRSSRVAIVLRALKVSPLSKDGSHRNPRKQEAQKRRLLSAETDQATREDFDESA